MSFTIYTQGQPANEQGSAEDFDAALDVAWTLARNANAQASIVDDAGTEVATVGITYPAPAEQPAQG